MLLIDKFKQIINAGAATAINDREFLELELSRWENSPERNEMITGELYYRGDHDILQRKRKAVGADGNLTVVSNLPNNRIVDNQYSKMVDQKTNYLLSKPLVFETESERYNEELKNIFDFAFDKQIKSVLLGTYNCGVEWLFPCYDTAGKFGFKRFPGYEVFPLWKDYEHTELDCAVRLYTVETYEGREPTTIKKVEVYTLEGIDRFVFVGNKLIPDVENPSGAYLNVNGQPANWEKIPLVCFKANSKEIPLIKKVKGLQDALNDTISDYKNGMDENAGGNGILIIRNYDGQDLGELRHNLMTYRMVKVKSIDGESGGVESLAVEVNAANYESILKTIKKALIENAAGYDAKDDRLGGNANQMNIKSMYSDIDLDADNTEAEFKSALQLALWFVNCHLANTGKGNFFDIPVKIVFNRDFMLDESGVIADMARLGVQVSNKTLLGQLPFVDDTEQELEQIQQEQQTADEVINPYAAAFGGTD